MSYHCDPVLALDELNEENLLPNPVFVRDMIFRAKLTPEQAREVESKFEPYLATFGEAQQVGRTALESLIQAAAQG